jgi:16S rRNA (uracil1498-N3)-methyltransferase
LILPHILDFMAVIFTESYFYAPELKSGRILLDQEESHHLFRVLRLNIGDNVFVTDGQGKLAKCRIEGREKDCAEMDVESVAVIPEEMEITLAAGLIRKNQFELLVELVSQLPVSRIIPFTSANTSVNAGFLEKALPRLNEKARCALKQSKKTRATRVEGLATFHQVLESGAGFDAACLFEKLESGQDAAAPGVLRAAKRILAVTGPEGGFKADEVQGAREKGFKVLGLGQSRLRAEAAAFAATVHLLTYKGSLS